MNTKRKATVIGAALAASVLLGAAGCESAADSSNRNLSVAAENFEVPRRIVAINGITGEAMLEVEGYCSYERIEGIFEIICLEDRASGAVMRTAVGLSDNVTFTVVQTGPVSVDLFQPRVIFRPETLVPGFELSTSARLQGDGNG